MCIVHLDEMGFWYSVLSSGTQYLSSGTQRNYGALRDEHERCALRQVGGPIMLISRLTIPLIR